MFKLLFWVLNTYTINYPFLEENLIFLFNKILKLSFCFFNLKKDIRRTWFVTYSINICLIASGKIWNTQLLQEIIEGSNSSSENISKEGERNNESLLAISIKSQN